jgi:hypothetical protein
MRNGGNETWWLIALAALAYGATTGLIASYLWLVHRLAH